MVQHMSERTREKLIYMGKTLRVYLPSRIKSAASTKTTHIHLVGHNKTGGPHLYEIEIMPAFHPSLAIEFGSQSQLNWFLHDLPKSAFSFDYDGVSNIAAERLDAKAHDTIYTLGSGPIDDRHAIYESLRRFFVNKGYVANSDVVSKFIKGIEETYVDLRGNSGPTFIRKVRAIPGSHQDQYVPATFARTCDLCPRDTERAQHQYRAPLQVETQSRQELDFCSNGPPKIKFPVQHRAKLVSSRQPDASPQLKRKAGICIPVTITILTLTIAGLFV